MLYIRVPCYTTWEQLDLLHFNMINSTFEDIKGAVCNFCVILEASHLFLSADSKLTLATVALC